MDGGSLSLVFLPHLCASLIVPLFSDVTSTQDVFGGTRLDSQRPFCWQLRRPDSVVRVAMGAQRTTQVWSSHEALSSTRSLVFFLGPLPSLSLSLSLSQQFHRELSMHTHYVSGRQSQSVFPRPTADKTPRFSPSTSNASQFREIGVL